PQLACQGLVLGQGVSLKRPSQHNQGWEELLLLETAQDLLELNVVEVEQGVRRNEVRHAPQDRVGVHGQHIVFRAVRDHNKSVALQRLAVAGIQRQSLDYPIGISDVPE